MSELKCFNQYIKYLVNNHELLVRDFDRWQESRRLNTLSNNSLRKEAK